MREKHFTPLDIYNVIVENMLDGKGEALGGDMIFLTGHDNLISIDD